MADGSKIEWTEATWSPVVGCSIVSPGCTHCYAMKMAARLERMGLAKYAGLTQPSKGGPVWSGAVRLDEASLMLPVRWRKPRNIFVNSMSDLFHEGLSDKAIDKVFAVMALAPQHAMQVLTKRSARMRAYCADPKTPARVWLAAAEMVESVLYALAAHGAVWGGETPWPLRNVWLGCSVEDQARADERRDDLRALADADWNTWVSYEPALGAVDWRGWEFIRWLVSGGESGKSARPSHPNWHRAARDFCAAHEIAYFFKQRGEWSWVDDSDYAAERFPPHPDDWRERDRGVICMRADGVRTSGFGGDSSEFLYRIGKRRAGALLDGREHKEMPK